MCKNNHSWKRINVTCFNSNFLINYADTDLIRIRYQICFYNLPHLMVHKKLKSCIYSFLHCDIIHVICTNMPCVWSTAYRSIYILCKDLCCWTDGMMNYYVDNVEQMWSITIMTNFFCKKRLWHIPKWQVYEML